MCVSNDAFEQRAEKLTDEIKKKTIYRFVKIEISQGQNPIIKSILLEDEGGNTFSVEPNVLGLRFATGEVTYQEYEEIQRKEFRNSLFIYSSFVAGLFLVGGLVIEFVT